MSQLMKGSGDRVYGNAPIVRQPVDVTRRRGEEAKLSASIKVSLMKVEKIMMLNRLAVHGHHEALECV